MDGTTFSAQVRQWTLERLEGEMNERDANSSSSVHCCRKEDGKSAYEA